MDPSVISFRVLHDIYQALFTGSDSSSFPMKGFYDEIHVNLFSAPSSFDNPEQQAQIQALGFTSSYDVMDILYDKVFMSPTPEEYRVTGESLYFMHIQFFSKPETQEVREHLKQVLQNFVIIFCCVDGSDEVNDVRILHSNSHFFNYVESLITMEPVTFTEPENPLQELAYRDLPKVLVGICHHLHIPLPSDIEVTEEVLVYKKPTRHDYEVLLKLLTRKRKSDALCASYAKKLFTRYGTNKKSEDRDMKYDVWEFVSTSSFDWKFDKEDLEYAVAVLLNKKEFTVKCPANTYSADLFSYFQEALQKESFTLMSFDVGGDGYLFFIVHSDDVKEIVDLSERVGLEVEVV